VHDKVLRNLRDNARSAYLNSASSSEENVSGGHTRIIHNLEEEPQGY
jgi:hypothetical protein